MKPLQALTLGLALSLSLVPAVSAQVSFAPVQLLPIGPQAVAVVAGDLDGDGDIDLAGCWGPYGGSGTVAVFLNNGAGIFTAGGSFTAGINPGGLAIGDIDGDGDLDIVKANGSRDGLVLLFNNGNATFAPGITLSRPRGTADVTLGDMDGDGDLDIVTANGDDNYTPTVSILRNNGLGSFSNQSDLQAGGLAAGVTTGDLDGDGDLDIAAAIDGGPYSPDRRVSVLQLTGSTVNRKSYDVQRGPYTVATGDLDGDGDLDLVSANAIADSISVLFNNGNATFARARSLPAGPSPADAQIADFNSDGKLDIVVANRGAQNISVFSNQGASLPLRQDIPVDYFGGYSLAIADFNGDGKPDVATAHRETDPISPFLSRISVLLNTTP